MSEPERAYDPNQFEVLGRVGAGGFRQVYRARDRSTGQVVALSVWRANYLSGFPDGWLHSGATLQSRLRHPNIERVLGAGRHAGVFYLVAEFLEGGSLEGRLARGLPEPEGAAALVETVAGAVHFLHLRGVLHRNLKPRNVLLAADGTPRLGGFGLAIGKEARDEASDDGGVAGTPSYMAPEQAAGRNRETGPATDEYALGGILYECLTGGPPFRSDSVMDVLRDVLHTPPIPPRQVRPQVPRALETVALRCLEKDPARRYASALDLASDLCRFRTGG